MAIASESSKVRAAQHLNQNWPQDQQSKKVLLDLYQNRRYVGSSFKMNDAFGRFSHQDLIALCVIGGMVPPFLVGKDGEVNFDIDYKDRPKLETFFDNNNSRIMREARKNVLGEMLRKSRN